MLKQLAANTESTINHLSENLSGSKTPPMWNISSRMRSQLVNLSAAVGNVVVYDNTRTKLGNWKRSRNVDDYIRGYRHGLQRQAAESSLGERRP